MNGTAGVPENSAANALLNVQGLNAFYGRAQILFDVSFDVYAGEVVALMGRNGAGKSTTLKSIVGLVPRCHGDIHFMGRKLNGLPSHRIARMGLGFVPEDRRVFSELTVLENLEVGRQPARADAPVWSPSSLFEIFPNLGRMPYRRGGQMSGGEQQMLTVARTLMGNPRLLLLDEPSEGVAPKIVDEMAAMILTLKKAGVAIVLSEQNFDFARRVCDRGYVLEKGQVRAGGPMRDLMHRELGAEAELFS